MSATRNPTFASASARGGRAGSCSDASSTSRLAESSSATASGVSGVFSSAERSSLAPASVLGDLGGELVVVHGQSDQVRLRSAVAQRAALDRYAGAELAGALALYQHAFHRWHANQAELDRLVP